MNKTFIIDMIVCAMDGAITGVIIAMNISYLIIPSIVFFIAFHILRWNVIYENDALSTEGEQ